MLLLAVIENQQGVELENQEQEVYEECVSAAGKGTCNYLFKR